MLRLWLRTKSVLHDTQHNSLHRNTSMKHFMASSLVAYKKCSARHTTLSLHRNASMKHLMASSLVAYKKCSARHTILSLHRNTSMKHFMASSLVAYNKCSARCSTFSTQEHKYETLHGFIFGCVQKVFCRHTTLSLHRNRSMMASSLLRTISVLHDTQHFLYTDTQV